MSDSLMNRLDNLWVMLEGEGFYTKADTAMLAKNRIEELEDKLNWVIVERDETFALMLDRAQTAEAKLAKAVEALEEAIYMLAPDERDMQKRAGVYRAVTALADLKGETQ